MRYRTQRSCKFCGKPGLVWGKFPNRYGNTTTWLVETDGSRHQCDEYRNSRVNPVTGRTSHPPAYYPPTAPVVPEPTPIIDPEPIQPHLVVCSICGNVDCTCKPTQPCNPHPVKYPVIEGSHRNTPELAAFLKTRVNVMLVGPAGSGKTYAAWQVANHLDVDFYPMSVGPQTSKSDLMGYMDAHGKLVRTALRNAFEYGGLFLLDEIDAGNAGVLTILNACLANEEVVFPDRVVRKHKNFLCIAGGNTFGLGANRQYVGRQQLDAATLDRFVGMEWDYDRELESEMFYGKRIKISYQEPTTITLPELDWLELIWHMRDRAAELGIRVVFGTRKIQNGKKLLDTGISRARVEECVLWFGVSTDDKAKLLGAN